MFNVCEITKGHTIHFTVALLQSEESKMKQNHNEQKEK